MKNNGINNKSENVIYLIFWLILFSFPIFLSTGGNRIDWTRVLHELIRIFPFFLFFLLNNFLLFKLIQNKKYFSYLFLSLTLVLIFSFLGSFNPLIYKFLNILQSPRQPVRVDIMWVLNVFFYNSIFLILGIGLNNAIKITIGLLQDKKNYEKLQKENLQNQLSILQNQISPHFFMNTLNNIHALIDYDKEIAKTSVVKLSKLMRMLLYENENYTLQKEIDFLEDYIELMKIRVNENVDIIFDYPAKILQLKFPPLLIISLVENSFKHGIKAIGKSFIHININFENNFLIVKIQNSKTIKIFEDIEIRKIGINNTRKRLELMYNNNYDFAVNENNTSYEVNIKIPTNEN